MNKVTIRLVLDFCPDTLHNDRIIVWHNSQFKCGKKLQMQTITIYVVHLSWNYGRQGQDILWKKSPIVLTVILINQTIQLTGNYCQRQCHCILWMKIITKKILKSDWMCHVPTNYKRQFMTTDTSTSYHRFWHSVCFTTNKYFTIHTRFFTYNSVNYVFYYKPLLRRAEDHENTTPVHLQHYNRVESSCLQDKHYLPPIQSSAICDECWILNGAIADLLRL